MARLIDADKIVNGIALYMAENAYLNDTPLDALKMVANWITDAPTVDAVEVVRCRECKYYCQDEIYGEMCRHPELDFEIECYDHWINTKPDDFCSYGERKDGDK